MMDLKIVKNIVEGVADINILSEIGGPGLRGDDFARELKFIEEFENVDEFNVHINSPGGNVIDALSIITALRNSSATINTIVEGVAASAAGVIALTGDNRIINDFAKIMLHSARIEGKSDLDENEKKAVEAFNEVMMDLVKNNTHLNDKDIEEINTTDVWFSAVKAKRKGLVDSVAKGHKRIAAFSTDLGNIAAIHREYEKVLNSNENENLSTKKPYKMETIKALLGLDSNCSEEVVAEAIKALKADLETAKTATTDVQSKLDALQTEADGLKGAAAEDSDKLAVEYVESAIKKGIYLKDQKDDLIVTAKVDLGAFKKLTEAIRPAHPSVSAQIDVGKDEKGVAEGDEVQFPKGDDGNVISFREMEKTDQARLDKIKANQLNVWFAMFEKQYGTPHADAPVKVEV